MLVANSFDLWQKDAFFSAAEEVQESADTMESAYRAWIRERRERSSPNLLDELCRELQTALGTAKWQLEEFEKAVRHDNTNTRHKQFISAIESQISHVEAALRESYIEEGRQPLRWVNLDEEERDDLAAFLSGTSQTTRSAKDECSLQEKQVNKKDNESNFNTACNGNASADQEYTKDIIAINKEANYVIEIKSDEVSGTTDDVLSQADRTSCTRKTCSSSNYGALRIVIADEDEQRNKFTQTVDATPKEKGSKPIFWKQKFQEYPQAIRAVHMFNQTLGRTGWFLRQFQSPLHLRYSCPVQAKFALLLTLFLIDFSASHSLWPCLLRTLSLPLFSCAYLGLVNYRMDVTGHTFLSACIVAVLQVGKVGEETVKLIVS
ncbi:syntaxin-6_N domain-containing protein [Senna tora]|uniref:Syntaxin-6_N domain-containing protein n=1 Tax=Senna tora TaxID=362788 RepID=A0A834SPL7_9FABA|nr:syntaxin-6_N domain-containing protein [Senna tora]